MATYRTAKLVAWYHQPKPRCQAITLAETVCSFSATHVGFPPKGADVKLCTIHAQMADFPVKYLIANTVLVRED